MKKNWKWDLSLVFSSPKKAQAKLEETLVLISEFSQKYRSRIAKLTREEFAAMEKAYARLVDDSEAIGNYAYLLASTQENNAKLQRIKEDMLSRLDEANKQLLFVELEVCALDNETYANLCASSPNCHFWADVRKFKPYNMSEDKEHIIADYAFHARGWQRLYKETLAAQVFKYKGEEYSEASILARLNDESMTVRHQVGRIINRTMGKIAPQITQIYNNLVKHQQVEDKLRGYATPVSNANLINGISDQATQALTQASREAYAATSHRYYALKAKLLNVKKLSYWDRNAPYAFSNKAYNMEQKWPNPFPDEMPFDWENVWPMIHKIYHEFSEEMGKIADKFIELPLIDVYPEAGKESGCYCQPMPNPYMPYILLNYADTRNDALAYAHELGHGIHEALMHEGVALKSEHTNIEAEIASIFGEALTFDKLYQQETCKEARFSMLAGSIEGQLNTLIRQIAFHQFEEKAFALRQKGELSVEQINSIWLETMQESLGSSVDMSQAESAWVYIHHFFDFPFYVYSYAASQCLVNALYQTYKSGEVSNFAEKYVHLLKNPQGEHYSQLLKADFGLDMEQPSFWHKGLQVIEDKITELETLSKEIF